MATHKQSNTGCSHSRIWVHTTTMNMYGRHLAPDAENQLAFSAENRLALDASLLTSTT